MIYLSAGHCSEKTSPNYDPGATGVNGRTEADETVRMRDKVSAILTGRGIPHKKDFQTESLREYLKRIQPGDASVVEEYHFNAFNGKATGTEVIVGDDYDKLDYAKAKETAAVTAKILGIHLRADGKGVITEGQSHRGKLGLMREQGTVDLVEICFIDNPDDMAAYDKHIDELAEAYADILIKYENMIN